jgi:hypothetical protein
MIPKFVHLTLATTILVCYSSSSMFLPLPEYVQSILSQDAWSLAHRDPYNWIIPVIVVYSHLIDECLVVCSLSRNFQLLWGDLIQKCVEHWFQRLILLVNQWWPWNPSLIFLLCILVRFMVMILLASFAKLTNKGWLLCITKKYSCHVNKIFYPRAQNILI